MYYTGFADEAASSIDKQIQVTKELGWKYIESRNIDGTNITDISDEKFEEVYEKLQEAGIRINCFGSAVANWGKNPASEEAFQKSLNELKRAIPRMGRLGTKMIRGMSFGIPKNFDVEDSPELEAQLIEKLKVLLVLCEDAGITYVHENCMNYFSQSYQHMDRLLEAIDSAHFKIVFDTGNPVFSDNRVGEPPYQKQTTWEAYKHLRDKICYVHIKDGVFLQENEGIFPETRFTFPGEGDGQVRKVLKDLLANGFDGGISIEPHMASIYHDKNRKLSETAARYDCYLEYGKRVMNLIEDIKTELKEEGI
ncbi:MAG: sugar phosphate isomerase/epimerase family protein [Halanaerobiales bacterium]